MITYNHAAFIQDAIESVLMQKFNFTFELVIGEDSSTDSTLEICKSYVQKNPGIIRLLSSGKNLGMMPNFIRTLNACTGKYIALCEGDDYWTDPYKLQKQVDFLEANEKYVICCHNAIVFSEESKTSTIFNSNSEKNIYSFTDVATSGWFVPSASIMFRNSVFKKINFNKNFHNGDLYLQLMLLSESPDNLMYFMNDVMSVYRIHSGGVSSKMTVESDNQQLISLLKYINEVTGFKFTKEIESRIDKLQDEIKRYFIFLKQQENRKTIIYRLKVGIIKLVIKIVHIKNPDLILSNKYIDIY